MTLKASHPIVGVSNESLFFSLLTGTPALSGNTPLSKTDSDNPTPGCNGQTPTGLWSKFANGVRFTRRSCILGQEKNPARGGEYWATYLLPECKKVEPADLIEVVV
jgi:hypothetical protein